MPILAIWTVLRLERGFNEMEPIEEEKKVQKMKSGGSFYKLQVLGAERQEWQGHRDQEGLAMDLKQLLGGERTKQGGFY